MGIRLRWLYDPDDDRLTVSDLWALVQSWLTDPMSGLLRVVHPEQYGWDLQAHLLAHVADLLAVANWQRGGDDKVDPPRRFPRPGVDPDEGLAESEKPRNLLFDNGQMNLDPEAVIDPREWMAEEDPRWQRPT